MTIDPKALLRRVVEIDYRHKHRHLPGTLSALPIIARIYSGMKDGDVFILSKGHSCAALYAILEARGLSPDVSKVHPERDVENGVTITAGSLGHGLPIAVGMAMAIKMRGGSEIVHVLMGDGEAMEGTTWESLLLARRFELRNLQVHLDSNGYQGSDPLLHTVEREIQELFAGIKIHRTRKGSGIKMFEAEPNKSVHLVTDEDYAAIMEELK